MGLVILCTRAQVVDFTIVNKCTIWCPGTLNEQLITSVMSDTCVCPQWRVSEKGLLSFSQKQNLIYEAYKIWARHLLDLPPKKLKPNRQNQIQERKKESPHTETKLDIGSTSTAATPPDAGRKPAPVSTARLSLTTPVKRQGNILFHFHFHSIQLCKPMGDGDL